MRPSLQTKDQTIPSYMKLNESFKSCASICLLDLNPRDFFCIGVVHKVRTQKSQFLASFSHPCVRTIWTTPYLLYIALINCCLN